MRVYTSILMSIGDDSIVPVVISTEKSSCINLIYIYIYIYIYIIALLLFNQNLKIEKRGVYSRKCIVHFELCI